MRKLPVFMSQKPKPPKISIPSCVAENRDAKDEWIRITTILGDKADGRDRSLLEDYCLTHALVRSLRQRVDDEGYTLESPKTGSSYTNPTVNTLTSMQGHLAALRRDLYFTPKSRIEKQTKATMSKSKSIKDSLNEDETQSDE